MLVPHQHKNKKLLDALGEDDFHEHENKDLLDSLSEDDFHEHENKDLLDGLSEASFHEHENKDLLDAISRLPLPHRAEVDPTDTDVSMDWWINTLTKTLWVCIDPTAETAVWRQIALVEV